MRPIGLLFLFVGFLTAAFFSVRQTDRAGLEWATIQWGWYVPSILLGVLGVAMIRSSSRDDAAETATADLQTLVDSIEQACTRLATLQAEREVIGVYGIHVALDERIVSHLNRFAEAREVLIRRYSLHVFAEIMDRFASGERQINRAWSASADGYIDEVWASLDRGQTLLEDARKKLLETTSQG
jgi:hypothetical protein